MALSTNEVPPKRPRRTRPTGEAEGLDRLGEGVAATVRVLLIEDDHVDIKLIRACAAAVKGLRLDLQAVSSIAEAHEHLSNQAFDLCITDYWLGHESSLRFLAAMRHRPHPLPVVVLTSLSTVEIRQLCLQAGAAGILGKEQLSPRTLEEAVRDALRSGEAGEPPAPPAGGTEGGARRSTLLDGFVRIVRALEERAPPGRGAGASGGEVRPVRASIRAFAGLSETARFGVFEQLAADRLREPRGGWSAAPAPAADLIEAVDFARSLIEAGGQTIAFARPQAAVTVACDEAALFFMVFELMSRVGEVTTGHGTISVAIDEAVVSCALHVSGTAPSGMPGLPVTLGALFTRVLRTCRGTITTVRNPGGGPILIMRFPRQAGSGMPPTAH